MPQRLGEQALGGNLVLEVERGRVDQGEAEGVLLAGALLVDADVDAGGADVGRVAAASLDELCDGRELVLGGPRRDDARVEQEPEE